MIKAFVLQTEGLVLSLIRHGPGALLEMIPKQCAGSSI